jgi:crossover junction endodeoxyribonuclease RuvC
LRILGIDPGSLITGYGVIEQSGGRLLLVDQGCIRARREGDFAGRLETIYTSLTEIIRRNVPEAVAIETPFSGLNPRSLIQLAQARGVILLAARTSGVELFEYSPRTVKSAVVGYGGAEKEQVAKMVRMLLPGCATLEMTADAADALAVAICHANSYRLNARLRIAR